MTPELRRLRRRELHRSRSVAVSVALILTMLALAVVGTEAVLAALGRPALLVAPTDAVEAITGAAQPWTLPAAAGALVLGLVAVIAAITPGRRARHALADERIAVVIDDGVLAGAISRRAAATSAVSAAQVTTTIGTRRGSVVVQPDSGYPVDASTLHETTRTFVDGLAVLPPLRTTVRVTERAVVAR